MSKSKDEVEVEEILEQVWQNGRNPVRNGKSYLYNTKALAALTALIDRKVIEELELLASYYWTEEDLETKLYDRIKELKESSR